MVTIVDYGMGNLKSIKNMLRYIGYDSVITSSIDDIQNAGKLILPGVGHFGYAMDNISKLGLKDVLDECILGKKIPTLGICLGMQLLTSHSEEGNVEGLGYIDASTKKFEYNMLGGLKIPHMGWDYLKIVNKEPLIKDIVDSDRFYFVHSYYVDCESDENVMAKTEYGITFDSVIYRDNIMGAQFHPEKSLKFGMKVLSSFMENY